MITKVSTKDYEEWKSLRHKYIGGSDAATVVGLNPFSSRYRLWAEKTDRIPPFEGNIATEVGTYLEDFVAQKFARETGKKIRNCNQSIFNDKYPFAIANVDRLIVGEDAGLEIKTTSELNTKRFKNGEYPSNYYVQCMHYMAITERKKWYLAVLIGNRDFKIFEIERDEEEISALMQAEKEFFELIKAEKSPEPDGQDCTTETINEIYSNSYENEIDLTPFLSECKALKMINEQMAELKEQKALCENRIKDYMGEADAGVCDGYKITWKPSSRNSLDTKALMTAHPEIDMTPFYKASNVRTFRFKNLI